MMVHHPGTMMVTGDGPIWGVVSTYSGNSACKRSQLWYGFGLPYPHVIPEVWKRYGRRGMEEVWKRYGRGMEKLSSQASDSVAPV